MASKLRPEGVGVVKLPCDIVVVQRVSRAATVPGNRGMPAGVVVNTKKAWDDYTSFVIHKIICDGPKLRCCCRAILLQNQHRALHRVEDYTSAIKMRGMMCARRIIACCLTRRIAPRR